MVVALDSTLIADNIHNLDKEGGWQRIEHGVTTGTDQFIGAAVTRRGETSPAVDLCGEAEAITGFILGYNTALETIDDQGYFYRDFNNPFIASKNILIGIPKSQGIYLVLSGTNKTIPNFGKIKCVDGVFENADTNDNYQMISEEPVTGAVNTRKYFYARWVKN